MMDSVKMFFRDVLGVLHSFSRGRVLELLGWIEAHFVKAWNKNLKVLFFQNCIFNYSF